MIVYLFIFSLQFVDCPPLFQLFHTLKQQIFGLEVRKKKRKQNKTKQNKTKQNKTKQNKSKQIKSNQIKSTQNKTKQNKTTLSHFYFNFHFNTGWPDNKTTSSMSDCSWDAIIDVTAEMPLEYTKVDKKPLFS